MGAEASTSRRRSEPSILHVDMDAYFASVEVIDHPELRGKPVVVGNSGARGVVASCTYEARAYGVRSAMPSARARQLCPQAIFVEGHYSRYAEISAHLRGVLLSFTPLVEPIGLDEAFLDVDGALRLLGSPRRIGERIRRRVRDELGLDCSVGAGRTKVIAKLASRAAKPRAAHGGTRPGAGIVVVEAADERAFLHPLPVERLWGVGPATAKRLHDLGVTTVGDLAALPRQALERRIGKAAGTHLLALAHGQDDDPVQPDRPTKSVGHEETFAEDLTDRAILGAHVVRMAESVAARLRTHGHAGRTVTVKVKLADFSTVTRAHTMPFPIDTGQAIAAIATALLEGIELPIGARLLGVSVSGLQSGSDGRQLAFDLDAAAAPGVAGRAAEAARRQEHWEDVMGVVDAVRRRFGTAAVGSASMVGPAGIVVPARRESPWGPLGDASPGGDRAEPGGRRAGPDPEVRDASRGCGPRGGPGS